MAGNQMPVLTLDVNEEHLKRLEAILEKYRNGLMIGPAGTPMKIPSRQPENNNKGGYVSSATSGSAGNTSGRVRDEKGGFSGSRKLPDSLVNSYKGRGETMFDKYLKELGKNAQGTLKTYKQINSTLKTTNSRLKSLFKTTVSWGAKIAAIGVAGPFGYGYMATKVAAQYSVAQGLGMTTAQMQAARSTYSPYFSGTEELVQHLANAQENPNDPNYAGLMALGINPKDGAAKNLPKLLSGIASLVKEYKGSGLTQSVINGWGLGFVDVTKVNQIAANLDKIPLLNERFVTNTKLLGAYLTPAMQEDYQNTASNLMGNGFRISNAWQATVSRFNPLIRRYSDSLTSSIEGFLNGENFKKILTEAGEGLEKLGNWLNSEKFKNDLDDFSLAVSRIAKAIWSAIKWISGDDKYFPGTGVGAVQADPALVAFGNKYLGGVLPGANPMTNQYTGEFYKQDDVYKNYRMPNELKRNIQNFVEQANNTYRLPENMMSAIAEVESSWNPLARGTPDEKGRFAKGMWQFWDSTWSEQAKKFGFTKDDVYDPSKSTTVAGSFLRSLMNRYHGDIAKVLTAYNGGRIDRDGNLSLRMETVKYLIKLLPQIQGAQDQHQGIMNQLKAAENNLQGADKNARAIIDLNIQQKPGSDILAQLAGMQQIPG
ncbi:lytic transglycosylase domain-containing protein [Escherichia coli]|nr:lytic transglycosylase domain-containing protein [Escherichia coli]